MNHTIVLRHSDRHALINPEQSPFAPLTFRGRVKAIGHGVFLRKRFSPIHEIYSGYANRCVDTAHLLAFPLSPIRSMPIRTAMDDYGYFSAGYIREGRFNTWLNQTFSGEYPWKRYADIFPKWGEAGFLKYSLREFGQVLLRKYLLSHNVLAVTHDCTIGPLMESLAIEFGFPVRDYMVKPTTLSGFFIEHDNGQVSAIKWLEFGKEPTVIW